MFEGIKEEMLEQVLGRLSAMARIKALPVVQNYSWLKIGAIGERAKTGHPVMEPYGTSRAFRNFDDLMFLPAQLAKIPLAQNTPINSQVTLGKKANKPLTLNVPFYISGYGYGVSVSKKTRIALSRAAEMVGTAVNSGEGGFLKEDREACSRYMVQYNRGQWGNKPEELKQADYIEVKVGQGAEGTTGFTDFKIGEDLREHFGIAREEYAVTPATFPEVKKPEDFKKMVDWLKEITAGVPIAVKIAAGNIEADIDVALYAGFDVICIDGAEGGTSSSMEVTVNNFCIPTLYGLVRANEYLAKKEVRQNVSLVMSAGFREAGDILKAIALGADAVALGSAALVALSYHQWDSLLLGDVPTDLFLYAAPDADRLDVEQATKDLANYLKATHEEMLSATLSIGKTNVLELNRDDMVALTREMAEITGVQLAYKPMPYKTII